MNKSPILRQELKYRISPMDRELLIRRLSAVLIPDVHGQNGVYTVRSLYYDTAYDNALQDSLAGNPEKVKYRLRMYNADYSFLRLEKKVKTANGGYKIGATLTRAECAQLVSGHYDFLQKKENAFLQECFAGFRDGMILPRSIVQYTRTAFGSTQGNVRITIDHDVRVCRFVDAFLDPMLCGTPIFPNGDCVLEVKYDRFLPDYIPHLIGIGDRSLQAISKYALGRQYY